MGTNYLPELAEKGYKVENCVAILMRRTLTKKVGIRIIAKIV